MTLLYKFRLENDTFKSLKQINGWQYATFNG